MDAATHQTVALVAAALALGVGAGLGAARVVRSFDPRGLWPPSPLAAGLVALAFAWAVATLAPGAALDASALVGSGVLAWILVCLALIDVRVYRLPDVLTLPLATAGLAIGLAGYGASTLDRCAAAAGAWLAMTLLSLGFRRLRGRNGLGAGDAKLLAAAGAWLGWRPLPWTVLIACGLAFAWIAARLARGDRGVLGRPLPFGAPLALAIWWTWLYGTPAL